MPGDCMFYFSNASVKALSGWDKTNKTEKKKNNNELCALYNFPGQFSQVNCFE